MRVLFFFSFFFSDLSFQRRSRVCVCETSQMDILSSSCSWTLYIERGRGICNRPTSLSCWWLRSFFFFFSVFSRKIIKNTILKIKEKRFYREAWRSFLMDFEFFSLGWNMWAWQFYLELLNNMPARSIGAIRKEEEEESAFKILMGISNNSSLKLLNNARGFLYIMERRTSNCYLQLYSRRQYNQLADCWLLLLLLLSLYGLIPLCCFTGLGNDVGRRKKRKIKQSTADSPPE